MEEINVDNFGSQVAFGMAVHEANGEKIGTVQQVELTNGWFQTEKGALFPRDRYIPFSAIDRIGPSGIYLNVTKDYVKAMLEKPPSVNVDVVDGPAGATPVGTVTSGYDGSRVTVDDSTISQAIDRLANGLKVYDSNGETVGRVYQYVPGSNWIAVEKGAFSPNDLFIPVTAVEYVDYDGAHLRVSKDVLQNAFVVKPIMVDAAVVTGPGGAVAVDTASSGIDAGRLLVDSTTINLAITHLGKGPKVYDSVGEMVGRVYRYDPAGGWIDVEKGEISPKDLFVPVSTVEYLDKDGAHLRVTKDVLKDAFTVQPATVTFVATTV
ncbi:MAG: hypothetical protein JWO42_3505 [Chloroflexi bacterium]|jgi:hypothetical protein|nr:hypothetical protein [Chloroflexota bacterium]